MIHRQNINKIMFSSAAYLKSVETMPTILINRFVKPGNTWSNELEDKLLKAHFEVYRFKGVKSARFNRMISDVVSWSFIPEEPSNLLILSQDTKEIEQFPNFSFIRQALEDKGFFVVSAEPDTLVNQETAFRGIELYNVFVLARRNGNAV